jgi:hypothetical protein
VHLSGLIQSFFDYAMVAEGFKRARLAELEQVSGDVRPFYVVPMPPGRRKPLMYDLISRIVDAEDLPIDLVIVSSWARTGWNVLSPNVLIDATATRSVTAWQQLRGRAMRPFPTWTNECYRLTRILVDSLSPEPEEEDELSAGAADQEDVELVSADLLLADGLLEEDAEALAEEPTSRAGLEESLRQLLSSVAPPDLWAKVEGQGLEALTAGEAQELAVDLMLARNKVTHIYELVKAYGSTSQVEYHRRAGVWRRREAIRIKHLHNAAVHPLTGELLRGAEHAPLLYADDPRTDIPSALEQRIVEAIGGRDGDIVTGWLKQRG